MSYRQQDTITKNNYNIIERTAYPDAPAHVGTANAVIPCRLFGSVGRSQSEINTGRKTQFEEHRTDRDIADLRLVRQICRLNMLGVSWLDKFERIYGRLVRRINV